jgi:hypothetical protein
MFYGLVQTLDRFPGGARSPKPATCFGMESPGPWLAEPFMGTIASVRRRGDLPDVRVIMMIMRVLVEVLLCEWMTGWNPLLECLFVRCTWVPVATSYQARP